MILAHKLASGTDPVGQNLSQPEPNPIRDDFAQYDPGRLWKNATESESGKTGSGLVAFCQKPGPMILVHRLASGPNSFGGNLSRPSRSDPGRFCTV